MKEKILQALQQINSKDQDLELREVLIDQFKQDFPDNLDWLEMFSQESAGEFEKYTTQLPEITGYQVSKVIGSGASGQVFSAIDSNSDTPVAIKIPM